MILFVKMHLLFCLLGVPEMMDELGRLSDSTSEEHSLHSYTSESFDDNGEWSFLILDL